jgi:hypothetical protein
MQVQSLTLLHDPRVLIVIAYSLARDTICTSTVHIDSGRTVSVSLVNLNVLDHRPKTLASSKGLRGIQINKYKNKTCIL